MKKLEDFKSEKIESLNLFIGGARTKTTRNYSQNGLCYTCQDSYDDRDGDGVWDSNEWGEDTVAGTVKEVQCVTTA